jgi:hypothetical protein
MIILDSREYHISPYSAGLPVNMLSATPSTGGSSLPLAFWSQEIGVAPQRGKGAGI